MNTIKEYKFKTTLRFNQEQEDKIRFIKEKYNLNTNSQAIRFIIDKFDTTTIKETNSRDFSFEETSIIGEQNYKQLNKKIDILTELLAGSIHENGIMAIPEASNTPVYINAIGNVEKNIQRAVTKRSEKKFVSDSDVTPRTEAISTKKYNF